MRAASRVISNVLSPLLSKYSKAKVDSKRWVPTLQQVHCAVVAINNFNEQKIIITCVVFSSDLELLSPETWSDSSSAGTKIRASREISEFPLGCALAKWPLGRLPVFETGFCSAVSSPDVTDEVLLLFMVVLLLVLLRLYESSSELPVNSKLTRVKFLTLSIFWRPYYNNIEKFVIMKEIDCIIQNVWLFESSSPLQWECHW